MKMRRAKRFMKSTKSIQIINLFHANTPSGVSIQQASKENLYQDLQWKEFYLEAKILGKSVDEMQKDWQNR